MFPGCPAPRPSVHLCLCTSSRVNCSFYFKIGACRHGDRCSRLHNKPTFSQVRPGTEPGGWLMPTRRLSSVVHHLEALPFPDF